MLILELVTISVIFKNNQYLIINNESQKPYTGLIFDDKDQALNFAKNIDDHHQAIQDINTSELEIKSYEASHVTQSERKAIKSGLAINARAWKTAKKRYEVVSLNANNALIKITERQKYDYKDEYFEKTSKVTVNFK